MNKETIEALRQIEKEKSIPFDMLIEALEDALHSAYNKTPQRRPLLRGQDRPGHAARSTCSSSSSPQGRSPTVEDEEADDRHLHGRAAGDHPRRLRAHRRADGQAGHLPAHPRGRAGHRSSKSTRVASARSSPASCSSRTTATPWSTWVGWRPCLPKSEQVPTERYEHGMRLKAVIKEVSQNPKEPPIILSRRSEELVRRLFELEVPEISRRAGRDRGRRPRARVPLQDLGGLAQRWGRPRRGVRRSPGIAGAHGGLRAAGREDRHHPLQRRAGALRGQVAVAGPGERGDPRRRELRSDGGGARRPAARLPSARTGRTRVSPTG